MQGLLPDKHQRKIFDMLVQAGLETIVREGEVSIIVECASYHYPVLCYLFIVSSFEPGKYSS